MSTKAGSLTDLISLPKGGGAVKGPGEKFDADLHTGTGNFSVPIALPAGRNGFKPSLSLGFSTGGGNGPFGLGWSLSVPGVSRLTSKRIPRYRVLGEGGGDTFVLSGAEDLVEVRNDQVAGETQYRPRTEGLFANITRHTKSGDHWVVQTKDGLTSTYGRSPTSTATSPCVISDPDDAERIFAWRLTETTDTFGNRIAYDYLRDNDQTRGHNGAQLYLSRIRYVDLPERGPDQFLVSVEFVYDQPVNQEDSSTAPSVAPEVAPLVSRPDPFSDYRAGFEIRTRRRCKWIVVRTHPTADRNDDLLVHAYELVYADERRGEADPGSSNGASLLARVNIIGFDDRGVGVRELPPLDFGYSSFTPDKRRFITLQGRGLPTTSLANPDLELVDLFGNGLPDILELSGESPRYWRNLGDGRFDMPRSIGQVPAGLKLSDHGVQLLDADGDGRADLLVTTAGLSGYYPLDFNAGFDRKSFHRFAQAPTFNLEDAEVRLIDLTGDGITDVLRSGTSFECYFNDATEGFSPERTARFQRGAPEVFPNVSFADQRVKLCDLSGDGLQDIAVVHQGRVDYWPNLGYGRFGERLTMEIPQGLPYQFDPQRVLIGDVDGDGLADLIYVADREVTLWLNRTGNGWSTPLRIAGTPPVNSMVTVRLSDILGTGVPGLLWTRDAASDGSPQHYFLDFTGGVKPYLLTRMENNLGAVTQVTYASSTRSYLRDQVRPETRWRTTLPFPVQVVERVTVSDLISNGELTTEYRYYDGHWDGQEREYRGFGTVDRIDTRVFDGFAGRRVPGNDATLASLLSQRSYVPPVLTRTWFHLGPVDPTEGGPWSEYDGSGECWSGDARNDALQYLPEAPNPVPTSHTAGIDSFLAPLPRSIQRDALRALRGNTLRVETYALDGSALQDRPYTVTEHAYALREIDAPLGAANRKRIFFGHGVAQRTTQWERGDDPMSHYTFTSDFDAYGQPQRQLVVACPRGWRHWSDAAGADFLCTLTLTRYAAPPTAGPYIADRVIRTRSYEVTQTNGRRIADLIGVNEGDATPKRLFAEGLTFYDGAPFEGLAYGLLGRHGVAVRSEALVLTEEILQAAYAGQRPPYLDPTSPFSGAGAYPAEFATRLPKTAGYTFHAADAASPYAGGWYTQAARSSFDFQQAAPPPRECGLLLAQRDPMGHTTLIAIEDYRFRLLPQRITGPTGLVTQADYNLRLLLPAVVTDPNQNVIEVRYSPGGLVAATFVRGKVGALEGDDQEPSVRMEYALRAFHDSRLASPASAPQPAYVRAVRRVYHDTDPADTGETIEAREYSDGFGRLLQTRTLGEAVRFGDARFGGDVLPLEQDDTTSRDAFHGTVNDDASEPNVTVSGWQRYDDKGRVVEKFEPFFDTGWAYRPTTGALLGRKVDMFYDAIGRVVRTLNPDGSEQCVIHGIPGNLADPPLGPLDSDKFSPTPWEAYTYDANDNAGRTHAGQEPHGRYRQHYNTPASAEVDGLGRTVRAVARHRGPPDAGGNLPPLEDHVTRSTYDIQGNLTGIRDALGRLAFGYLYDLANHPLHTLSIDAGSQWTVWDAAGNAIEHRDAKGALQLRSSDALHRPVRLWARDAQAEALTLRERLSYGDDPAFSATAAATNRLGQLVRHDDEAGRVELAACDFKGNPLQTTRRVLSDDFLLAPYRAELALPAAQRTWALPAPSVDWDSASVDAALAPALDSRSAYDALNRIVWSDYPQAANGERYRLRPTYNRAGALEAVALLGPLDANDRGLIQPFVQRLAYDAKGQRTLVAYGNGILTRYAHDPLTFRLARMRTERWGPDPTLPADSPGYALRGAPLQDIAYRYDLAGNILSMQDLTPGCGVARHPDALLQAGDLRSLLSSGDALLRRFTYDPLYRLTSATGRDAASYDSLRPWADLPGGGYNSGNQGVADQDNAPNLCSPYAEEYDYDAAGNMLAMRHQRYTPGPGGGWQMAWSRRFGMDGRAPDAWRSEVGQHMSGDWVGAPSNRLTHMESRASGRPTPPVVTQSHWYDASGNMVREHTERTFEWDHADRMKVFRKHTGTSQPTTFALYLYDAMGMRIKKLVVNGGDAYRTTTFLGASFEHHTEQKLDGSERAENCSLHISDGKSRIAIVRIGPAFAKDGAAEHAVQYHLGDHLGSSIVVVADGGEWINREEYSPFGETSFGSFGRKRFRFTGKERDEENGLGYHDARLFASYIARWISCDPSTTKSLHRDGDDINTQLLSWSSFQYCHNNPARFVDPEGTQETDLAQEVVDSINRLQTTLSEGSVSHAITQASQDMALGEAQGATAWKDSGEPYKHIMNIQQSATAIRKSVSEVREALTELSAEDSGAAKEIEEASSPFINTAVRIAATLDETVERANELRASFPNRLADFRITELDRATTFSERLIGTGRQVIPEALEDTDRWRDYANRVRELPRTLAGVGSTIAIGVRLYWMSLSQSALRVGSALRPYAVVVRGAITSAAAFVARFVGTVLGLFIVYDPDAYNSFIHPDETRT
ncbi:SpvB/TcaC N-terminal domain-containing protein [Ideonella sp. A 288]|uniref:SpvB/TcaC N-terminal domain-containing protein n=1 Tax=Ideonella sp. A 288 TaxID=1962181 RepID=UPI000B4BEAE7|nr:SpvB/TcaC N-terminal domain-containing protein [Ideonella sp. A 288]